MKKAIALIAFAILAITVRLQAEESTPGHSSAQLYKQLCKLNAGWSQRTPNFGILPDDERSTLIQTHLQLVIDQLEQADVTNLNASQRAQRAAHIETLNNYMLDGVFPQNVFVAGIRPVFIDPWGTHCAVGHLIAISGHSQLARSINDEHQLDYLRDIKTDGLNEWQAASGLSFDELALIQPQYPWRNTPVVQVSYPKELRALFLGDSSAIKKAIQKDKSLLKARCGGKTILHFAAAAGDLELVRFLVDQGADLNAVSQPGREKIASSKKKPLYTIHVCEWNKPSQISYARKNGIQVEGYFIPHGRDAYVADLLQDADGGVADKNALYFAEKKQKDKFQRRVAVGPFGKKQPSLFDTLNKDRSDVAKWLKEQGLK